MPGYPRPAFSIPGPNSGLPLSSEVRAVCSSAALYGSVRGAARECGPYRDRFSETTVFAVAVGFVGAYTTFSTYMFESNGLIEDGAWIKAGFNVIGSVVVGLLAVRLGIYLAAK